MPLCRQRGGPGSEWAGCRGVRRAQASWRLEKNCIEVIVKEAEPVEFVAFHTMTVNDVWRYLIEQHKRDL